MSAGARLEAEAAQTSTTLRSAFGQWREQVTAATSEAHVPGPGLMRPMPKKVAMSQERRDLEVEIDVILFQTAIEYFYHIVKLRYVPPIDIRYKNSDTPVNIDNRYKKGS